MIEMLPGFPDNVLAIACSGRITRRDYEEVVIPAATAALARRPTLRVYYEVRADFAGVDVGAAWEDFLLGMGQLRHWERIAVVTDVAWIGGAIHLFRFLLPCPVRVFALAEVAAARAWVAEGASSARSNGDG